MAYVTAEPTVVKFCPLEAGQAGGFTGQVLVGAADVVVVVETG